MKLYEDESILVTTTEETLGTEQSTEVISETQDELKDELGSEEVIMISGFVALFVSLLICVFSGNRGFYDPDRMY